MSYEVEVTDLKYWDIDCIKCEQHVKPEHRNCKECSRVYNEHHKDLPRWPQ